MCADVRVAIRQVAEMHLDERLEKSREVLGKQIAVGQQKVSSAYNRLWAEMEAMREAQRKRAEEARLQAEKEGRPGAPGQARRGKDGGQRHRCPRLHRVISRERKTSNERRMRQLVILRQAHHLQTSRDEVCFSTQTQRRPRTMLKRIDTWTCRLLA